MMFPPQRQRKQRPEKHDIDPNDSNRNPSQYVHAITSRIIISRRKFTVYRKKLKIHKKEPPKRLDQQPTSRKQGSISFLFFCTRSVGWMILL